LSTNEPAEINRLVSIFKYCALDIRLYQTGLDFILTGSIVGVSASDSPPNIHQILPGAVRLAGVVFFTLPLITQNRFS
jgi:hypothetical protein